MATPPPTSTLAQALVDAEDTIAFFARAAILRHCASIAAGAGAAGEAARLTELAKEAETKVAIVIRRVAGQLVGSKPQG